MRHRALKRFVAVVAAPLLAFFAWFAFAGSASAHDVTSITADCNNVTVHFANFPQEGVMVHIAAQVGAQATLSKDVLVSATTTEAQLNISSETNALAGASANVDVHVTWDFNGPQDVHAVLSVTCGSSTTTTTETGSGGTASGITATCDVVTVHFANFPEAGVMVHISAEVEGHGTLTKDVLVTAATTESVLNISSATNALAGATANVDVHVTWTLNGSHEAHATVPVTCGTATTTTTAPKTTTTSGETTSTTVAGVTVHGGGNGGTSGGRTVGVSGSTNVAGQTAVGATGAVGTSGETSLASGTSPTAPTSLAFTGNSTGPLVLAGLVLLTIGSAALAFARKRTARA